MKQPTVLHEILAVEGDRETAAANAMSEVADQFTNRKQLFLGQHSIYEPFDSESPDGLESHQEMAATVVGVLDDMMQPFARALDVTATKDVTNQSEGARAAVTMGNSIELTQPLPATTLLMLESRLKALGMVINAIPVLSDGREWVADTSKGPGVYKDAHPKAGFTTRKVPQSKIIVEPTPHHPAQIEKWMEDEKVGRTTTTSWSSMMTPAAKASMISRLEELRQAVKQARMRANTAPITQTEIAGPLLDFVLYGALNVTD